MRPFHFFCHSDICVILYLKVFFLRKIALYIINRVRLNFYHDQSYKYFKYYTTNIPVTGKILSKRIPNELVDKLQYP